MDDDRADLPVDTDLDRAVGARVRLTAGRNRGRTGVVVSRSVDAATGLEAFVVELDRSGKRVRCPASALEPEG